MFKKFLILCLIAFAAWLSLNNLFRSEEDILKERLSELTKLCQLEALAVDTPPIEVLAKAKKISTYFRENVAFYFTNEDFEYQETISRRKVQENVILAIKRLDKFESSINNLEVSINLDSAEVILDASALGSMVGRDDDFFDLHRVKVSLKKEKGDWLISSVEHLKNLRD